MILKGFAKRLTHSKHPFTAFKSTLLPLRQPELTQAQFPRGLFGSDNKKGGQGGKSPPPESNLFKKKPREGQEPQQQHQKQRQQHQQKRNKEEGQQHQTQKPHKQQRQFEGTTSEAKVAQNKISSQHPYLNEGEYIHEEEEGLGLESQETHDFEINQSRPLEARIGIEEFLGDDVVGHESVAEAENSIKVTYSKFGAQFKLEVEAPMKKAPTTGVFSPEMLKLIRSEALKASTNLSKIEESQPQEGLHAEVVPSPLYEHLQSTLQRFESLKDKYGSNNPILRDITEESLRRSPQLRYIVNDYETLIFLASEAPMSFKKTYRNAEEERIDKEISYQQSNQAQIQKKYEEVTPVNEDKTAEALKGEEGTYQQELPPGVEDPELPSDKRLARELKGYIQSLKIEDPEKAEEARKFFLQRNEIDESLDMKTFDPSEVKYYPGSVLGPKPEDDPEAYSKWFVENQPKSLYPEGTGNFRDIGGKMQVLRMVRDEKNNIENKSMTQYFLDEDEHYPLQTYSGQPEFSIFERERYNVDNEEEMPQLVYSTQMAANDLPPIQADHEMEYQKVHYELERYTIFRALPEMLQFDQGMVQMFQGVHNGTIKVPDYLNTINPPSLWAYYSTLPKWCRDNPFIQNVMMAFEYHKFSTSIRDKELALNFACSYIRPIDKQMEEVILEISSSNKIRMNVAKGKEMISDLKFYEIDEFELGTDSEDEDELQQQQQIAEDKQEALDKGIGVDEEEEESRMNQKSAMEKFASGLDSVARDREMRKIQEEEMSITDFQVEPEMEKVLTDFYVKPYPTIYDVNPNPDPVLPLNFYDNDDGFWDKHIQRKTERWGANDMIINRRYFKH